MSYKILYIEDDPFSRKLVRHILERAGYAVIEAIDGLSGIQVALDQRPDLILMDVGLPGIDGIETLRRLKAIEQFAQIPVIIITGHSEKAVVVESLKAGAADFAVKPYDKDVLLAKVRNYLHIAHA